MGSNAQQRERKRGRAGKRRKNSNPVRLFGDRACTGILTKKGGLPKYEFTRKEKHGFGPSDPNKRSPPAEENRKKGKKPGTTPTTRCVEKKGARGERTGTSTKNGNSLQRREGEAPQ